MKYFFTELLIILISLFLLIKYKNYISNKFNLIDLPDHRKLHLAPTSLIGGFIFFILFSEYFFLEIYFYDKTINISFYLVAMSMFIIGFIDDVKKIKAFTRLTFTFLIFYIFFFNSPEYAVTKLNSSILGKTIELKNSSIFFSILCMALLINAMNMIDGANGLFLGTSLIIFFYIFLSYEQINFLIIFVIFLLLLFLFFNLKNLFFMGDSGVYLITTIMGIIIIQAYNNDTSSIKSIEQIFIILIVPGLDMLRLFIKRILNKKNPFMPDNQHLHHLLIKKFNYNRAICFYLLIVAATNQLSTLNMLNLNYVIFFLILMFIFLIIIIDKKN